MKLAVSNIAWTQDNDYVMYRWLAKRGIQGLEIAPTRLFPQAPYERLPEAAAYAKMLLDSYGLEICSLQSIWYGRKESLFGTSEEMEALYRYTCQAIAFAQVVGARNLVFGCPRNRNLPSPELRPLAIMFFRRIGQFASQHDTCIAIEPNPPYYQTNFINTTQEAFDICREIAHPGVRVNVDLGTCIHYQEDISLLKTNISLINHIHISEPMLAPVQARDIHRSLRDLFYDRWCSIEMKAQDTLKPIRATIDYMMEITR